MFWYHYILATLFAFMAIVLMGVILLQRGKGVGLSGAFGGAGGHTAFGAKTGDVLTWATIIIATVLLTFAVILNYVFVPPTPFAPPAALPSTLPPVVPSGSGTQTPAPTPGEAPTPTARPVSPTPVETTPPADADAPTESAPPPESDSPTESDQAPEGTRDPGDPAARPQYVRQIVLRADLG